MEKAGVDLFYSIHDLEVIGFSAIIKKYFYLKKIIRELVDEAVKRKADMAVLIDYPGFNLRLAGVLKQHGIKVIQVVSPQIWAWNYKRIYKIKENVDNVLCLYPFETEIYQKENIPAEYIGHPLSEEIYTFIQKKKASQKTKTSPSPTQKKKKTIALLPGSRTGEIKALLPEMIETARRYLSKYPGTRFLLTSPNPVIDEMDIPDFITKMRKNSHEVIYQSDAAIACSGTVTFELALFNVPYYLLYKTSSLNYHLFKRLIKIPYIGIANVIAKKFIVKEFLQKDISIEKMYKELENITQNKQTISEMKKEFRKIQKEMGHFSSARKASDILTRIT